MKQAEADIAQLEKELTCYHFNEYQELDQKRVVLTVKLDSAREKYRSLKYEYTIQSTVLILVVFTATAVLTSYLLGGV